MSWSKTVDGQVSFSGPIVRWMEKLRGRYDECYADFWPINFQLFLTMAATHYAARAKTKWQSAWFAKGKLAKLDAMCVHGPGGAVEIKPFDIFDFLADELGFEFFGANFEQVMGDCEAQVIELARRSDRSLLAEMLAEKLENKRLWFRLLSRAQCREWPRVPLETFVGHAAKYFGQQRLAQAKHPEAPVIKDLTPLLASRPDGSPQDPLGVHRYIVGLRGWPELKVMLDEYLSALNEAAKAG